MTKLADIYGLLCELDIPVTYRQFSGAKQILRRTKIEDKE